MYPRSSHVCLYIHHLPDVSPLLKRGNKKKTNPVILDLSIKGVLIKRNYVSTESTVKQASHPKIVLPLTSMGGKIELVITVE